MNNGPGSPSGNFTETVQQTVHGISENVASALDQGAARVSEASDAVTRFRSNMRRQPITMAFVMLALGYMIGTNLRR